MATMQSTKPQLLSASRTQKMAAVRPAFSSCSRPAVACKAAPLRRVASPAPVATPSQPATVVRAAPAPAPAASSNATKEWYALVASAEFFFVDPQNESMAEQLRERVRFFKEQGKESDMYIVPEPKWLDSKYPELAKKVKRPCVALVSTDKQWITFMKLRLDRVLRIDLGAIPDAEALAVGGQIGDLPKPDKWTAPYSRYAPGWWEVFMPK